MYATYLQNIAIRTLKSQTHLKISFVRSRHPMHHIGALVVVRKRAVIEDESHVRVVVAEDVVVNQLVSWDVFGQIQRFPDRGHYLIFFKSLSCKNSVTACSKINTQILI